MVFLELGVCCLAIFSTSYREDHTTDFVLNELSRGLEAQPDSRAGNKSGLAFKVDVGRYW